MSERNNRLNDAEQSFDIERPYEVQARRVKRRLTMADVPGPERILLAENSQRVGLLIYNDTGVSILIAFDNEAATEDNFSTKIGAYSEKPFEAANLKNLYKGQITYNPESATTGTIMVTEFIKVEERVREL